MSFRAAEASEACTERNRRESRPAGWKGNPSAGSGQALRFAQHDSRHLVVHSPRIRLVRIPSGQPHGLTLWGRMDVRLTTVRSAGIGHIDGKTERKGHRHMSLGSLLPLLGATGRPLCTWRVWPAMISDGEMTPGTPRSGRALTEALAQPALPSSWAGFPVYARCHRLYECRRIRPGKMCAIGRRLLQQRFQFGEQPGQIRSDPSAARAQVYLVTLLTDDSEVPAG